MGHTATSDSRINSSFLDAEVEEGLKGATEDGQVFSGTYCVCVCLCVMLCAVSIKNVSMRNLDDSCAGKIATTEVRC